MSVTDDLFGSTDNSAQTNEWLWRKAVTDMMNAEYPGIQDWLNSGYNNAIGSTNQVYGMINDRLTDSLNNQINVLSHVPGMTYNTLANGYNLAGQNLMGAPGSMLNVPAGGYAPPTYMAPQSYIPTYNPYQPVAYQQPYQQPIPAYQPQMQPSAQLSAPAPAPIPLPQGAATQPNIQPNIQPDIQSGFGTTPNYMQPEAVPGGFTENIDGQFSPKPGLADTVNSSVIAGNPGMYPPDMVAAQYNAQNWQDPIYSAQVPWDNQRNTGMGASPTNPYNYPIHTDSALYQGLTQRGVDADALFQAAKDQGVHPMRLVYQMQNPELLRAVSDQDFNSGRGGAAGVNDLARVAGISADEMNSFLGGGQYVAPYENRDSVINLPESSRSLAAEKAERFATRGSTPTAQNVVGSGEISTEAERQAAREASKAAYTANQEDVQNQEVSTDRPTAEQQAEFDRMTAQFGSSPTQGARPAPEAYSPLQAAIDATRRVVAAEPENAFARQKLAELEGQLSGGSTLPSYMQPQRMELQNPQSALPQATSGSLESPQVNTGTLQDRILQGEYIPASGFGTQSAGPLPSAATIPQAQAAVATPQAAAQTTAGPQAQTAPQSAEFPWQGAQTYGPAMPGTGLQGSADTYNAALGNANATLGMGGQSAVNAIGSGVTQGNNALTGSLMGGLNAIGSGANQGRSDLLNMSTIGFGALSPYQSTGTQANTQMAALNGLSGNAAQQNAIQSVMASPEFDFYREQGNQGVLRNASALGGLGGGNVMKELSRFNQGLASTQYNTHYNRLAGMSGQGLQAAGQAAGLSGQFGSNLANLGLGMGTAQGALYGDTGQAMARNALTGGLAAGDIISGTSRGQAANTMGTGSAIGGQQFGTGTMLADMAWGGANTLANQYPGLAQTAANAYGNYGSLSAGAGTSLASQLANLYTGQGQSLANNAYNRANVLSGFGNYSQPVQNPGILGGLAGLASGIGTGLGGYAAYAGL